MIDSKLPFLFTSASDGLASGSLKRNFPITNNHINLGPSGEASLQGPFTFTHVGGFPHRHAPFGTADSERPEAYKLTFTGTQLTISKTPINKPKSMFLRQVQGTMFANITNIAHDDSTGIKGNFENQYEVLMVTGRDTKNTYLLSGNGDWLSQSGSTSTYIQDITDFEVPERPRTEYVITNRFSAIGGPETTALTRDRETEEYSVYNTVNYRNLVARSAQNIISAEHSKQFGYRSGSITQGSIHKINRNTKRFILGSEQVFRHDNEFVRHQIPQADYQYSWVTNSVSQDFYKFLERNDNMSYVDDMPLRPKRYLKDFSQESAGSLPVGWSTIKSDQTASYVKISDNDSISITASGGSTIFPGAPLVAHQNIFMVENRIYRYNSSTGAKTLEYTGLKPAGSANAAAIHAGIGSFGTGTRAAVIRKNTRTNLWNPNVSTLKLDIHTSSSSGWSLEKGNLPAFPNDSGFHFPNLSEVRINFDGPDRILYLAGNQIDADYVTHYASSSGGWALVSGSNIFHSSDQNNFGVMTWDGIGDKGVTIRGINNSQPRAHFFSYNGSTGKYQTDATVLLTSSADNHKAEAPRAVKLYTEEDVMIVSYATNDLRYSSLQGLVRVYFGISTSGWAGEYFDITCPVDDYADNFGHSIDFDGVNLIIGSPGTDSVFSQENPKLIENDQGASFLYSLRYSTKDAVLQHSLFDTRDEQESNANFGKSVAITNTTPSLAIAESPGEKYAHPQFEAVSTNVSTFKLGYSSSAYNHSLSGSIVSGSGGKLALVMKGDALTRLEVPQFPSEYKQQVGDFFRVFESTSPITPKSSEFITTLEILQGSTSSSDASNSIYGAVNTPTSTEKLVIQCKLGSAGDWSTIAEVSGIGTTGSAKQKSFYKVNSTVVNNQNMDDVYIRIISNTRNKDNIYWVIGSVLVENTSYAINSAGKLLPNTTSRKNIVKKNDFQITAVDFVDPYFSELSYLGNSWESSGGSHLYWGTSSADFQRSMQVWLKPGQQPVLESGELEALTVSYSENNAEASAIGGTGIYPESFTSIGSGWVLSTIYSDSGKIRFRFLLDDASTEYHIETKQEFDPNQWYHVAITYDGQEATTVDGLKIYVNSKKIDTISNRETAVSSYTGMSNNSTVSRIPRLQLGAGNYDRQKRRAYFGKMAHVAIFNKELSSAEVSTLYSLRQNINHNYSLLRDPFKLLDSTLGNNTIVYWPLNEQNKQIYQDSSTEHYHLYKDIVRGVTLTAADPEINEGTYRLAPFMSTDTLIKIVGLNQQYDLLSHTTQEALDNSHYLENLLSPYSYPSWAQVRGGSTPAARKQKRENKLAISVRDSELFPSVNTRYNPDRENYIPGSPDTVTSESPRESEVYDEVMLSSRYSPLTITLHSQVDELSLEPSPNEERIVDQETIKRFWEDDQSISVAFGNDSSVDSRITIIKATAPNDLSLFSNEDLNDKLELDEYRKHNVLQILQGLASISREESTSLQIAYKESIYPKEVNTFTEKVRSRTNFDFYGWRKLHTDRELLLSGSNSYGQSLVNVGNTRVFPDISIDKYNYKNTNEFFVDSRNITNRLSSSPSVDNLTVSRWPLDARKDFTQPPANLQKSYFNQGDLALLEAEVGDSAAGTLQNDYNIFGLGYNGLYGTPPPSALYSRRVPQVSGPKEYLAGEAKWQAAEQSGMQPFENSDKSNEKLKRLWKDHSLVPEYRVSDFVEDIVLNNNSDFSKVKDQSNYLSIEGALYNSSSQEISVGTTFFKTYGTSDFMKYFGMTMEEAKNNQLGGASQITLKCNAAIKFTPYRGFYPAERSLQISEIFSRGYMPDFSFEDQRQTAQDRDQVTSPRKMLERKIRANIQQSMKPLMSPGVLYNSIKSGLAVDYPIFASSSDDAALSSFNTSIKQQIEPLTQFDTGSLSTLGNITGSMINNSLDSGIPRLKGPVYKRISFEDLLEPQRLLGTKVYDNEPHPSASIYYGDRALTKAFDYPFQFGRLDAENNQSKLFASNFMLSKSLDDTLVPYKMAINNFCAETVNFFLEGGKLATLESDQVNPNFVSGTDYKMRVYVKNNSVMMYDRHSAFGPPVDEGDLVFTQISGSPSTNPGRGAIANIGSAQITVAASSIGTTNFVVEDASSSTITVHFRSGSIGSDITTGSYGPGNLEYDVSQYGKVYVSSNNSYIDLGAIEATAQNSSEAVNRLLEVAVNYQRWQGNIAVEAALIDGNVRLRQLTTGSSGNTSITSTGNVTSVYPSFPSAFISGSSQTTNFTGVSTSQVINSSSHEYAPFVPPYLSPGAEPYVEITFTPDESRVHSLEEILQGSTYSYVNFKDVPSNSASNSNYKNAMSISASLDLRNFVLYQEGDVDSGTTLEQRKRWVIQTKWETPLLNFKNVSVDALNLSSSTVESVTGSPWQQRNWNQYLTKSVLSQPEHYLTASTGMWHQYGSLLSSNEGYTVSISPVEGISEDAQLAKKVGFLAEDMKPIFASPGKIAEKKEISEAVVAIPFYVTENGRKIKFFTVKNNVLNAANTINDNKKSEYEQSVRGISRISEQFKSHKEKYLEFFNNPGTTARDSVAYQLRMMSKFVFPPQFDYMTYPDLSQKPMMYVFQFNAELSRQDLSNIWQNLSPESLKSGASVRGSSVHNQETIGIRQDIQYVSNFLTKRQLPWSQRKAFFQNDVRWLIFKVKQRSEIDLANIKMNSLSGVQNNLVIDKSRTSIKSADYLIDKAYSYNWPYDYFSLVELIKIDGRVDFMPFGDDGSR